MDVLKDLIKERKEVATNAKNETGGGRWIHRGKAAERMRSEVERRAAQEDRKRRRAERAHLKELAEHFDQRRRKIREEPLHESRAVEANGQNILAGEEEAQPPLLKLEVVRKLRRLKEPITLFGETDWQRYTRMCQLELLRDEDELMGGQRNAFLNAHDDDEELDDDDEEEHRDSYAATANISSKAAGNGASLRQNVRQAAASSKSTKSSPIAAAADSESARATAAVDSVSTAANDAAPNSSQEPTASACTAAGAASNEPIEHNSAETCSTAEQRQSRESTIIRWIRRMLHEWEAELKARTDEAKNNAEGKFMTSLHRQTRKDVKPLLKKLKRKELESDTRDKLFDMVVCCKERKYKSAHDTFLLLSIGNAAWPVGVTMVGIHERVGRSKLFTSQVAHILNDETTRKYIQMFKRLMSFCQRRYPADPSQTISLSTIHI